MRFSALLVLGLIETGCGGTAPEPMSAAEIVQSPDPSAPESPEPSTPPSPSPDLDEQTRVDFSCVAASDDEPPNPFDAEPLPDAPASRERAFVRIRTATLDVTHDLGRYPHACLGPGEPDPAALANMWLYLSDEGGDYGYILRVTGEPDRFLIQRNAHNNGWFSEDWETLVVVPRASD